MLYVTVLSANPLWNTTHFGQTLPEEYNQTLTDKYLIYGDTITNLHQLFKNKLCMIELKPNIIPGQNSILFYQSNHHQGSFSDNLNLFLRNLLNEF